jgi:hypothetical protein
MGALAVDRIADLDRAGQFMHHRRGLRIGAVCLGQFDLDAGGLLVDRRAADFRNVFGGDLCGIASLFLFGVDKDVLAVFLQHVELLVTLEDKALKYKRGLSPRPVQP